MQLPIPKPMLIHSGGSATASALPHTYMRMKQN